MLRYLGASISGDAFQGDSDAIAAAVSTIGGLRWSTYTLREAHSGLSSQNPTARPFQSHQRIEAP